MCMPVYTCKICLQDEEKSPTRTEHSSTEEERRFSVQENVVSAKAVIVNKMCLPDLYFNNCQGKKRGCREEG